jgi:hypothetical protein
MLRAYHDWVQDKPPQEALPLILREAIMIGGGEVKIGAPKEQFDKYLNNGLAAAARRDGLTITQTSYAAKSEGQLKNWLTKRERDEPVFLVADEANWTINALFGGYARKLEKDGTLAPRPTDNQYGVLLEALESFVAWFDSTSKMSDTDMQVRYATSTDGRRYLTSLPQRHS